MNYNVKSKHDDLIEQLIHDDKYKITKYGKIYSFNRKNGKQLNSHPCTQGYDRVYYKGTKIRVHRIVYRKFKGVFQEGMTIHHIDNNRNNNNINNIEQIPHELNLELRNYE